MVTTEYASPVRMLAFPVLCGAAVLMGVGCSVQLGPSKGSVSQATEIRALKDEVVRLKGEQSAMEDDLRSLRADRTPAEVDRSTGIPTPDHVSAASGSAIRLSDSSAQLRLRLRTEDGFSRFVQTAGPAVVSAIAFDSARLPLSLGDWKIDAASWRKSLREGFTGTAYALDLPLSSDLDLVSGMEILIRVEIIDPRAAEPLTAEFSIPVIDPLPERTPV